jgi:hypothetical protein
MHKIKLPDTKVIVFNAAAALIMVGALGSLVRTTLFPPTLAGCSTRYAKMTMMRLEQGGQALSAADFQANLAGQDGGVLENISVEKNNSKTAPHVLGVKLGAGKSILRGTGEAGSGVSFPWRPIAGKDLEAACLSYSVFVPEGFDFSSGGTLPGLLAGMREGAAAEHEDSFKAPLFWYDAGKIGAQLRLVMKGNISTSAAMATGRTNAGTGRWVAIEQEIILNKPGTENGIVRVWVDGDLRVSISEVALRETADLRINGVAVDVHYGTFGGQTPGTMDAQLRFTPFYLRWDAVPSR